MKSLFFFLTLGACAFAMGCNEDEDDDKKTADAVDANAENAVTEADATAIADVCKYLVSLSGNNMIEMNFDLENASAESIQKAEALCVEEMKGVPACRKEMIALYSCEADLDAADWVTIDAAIADCVAENDCGDGETDEDKDCRLQCFDKAYPCTLVDGDLDRCWNGLDDSVMQSLSSYLDGYYDKYKGL